MSSNVDQLLMLLLVGRIGVSTVGRTVSVAVFAVVEWSGADCCWRPLNAFTFMLTR
jgi:hypothetical protein